MSIIEEEHSKIRINRLKRFCYSSPASFSEVLIIIEDIINELLYLSNNIQGMAIEVEELKAKK